MLDALVTTEWLTDHLTDDDLRVVDIRGHVLPASAPPPHYFSHHGAYVEAHIPGAVFVDWTRDIVEPDSPTYDVANPKRYAALLSTLGIGNNSKVVIYDDANGMFAARFWWTLQYYGHTNAAVLDGGWQKWVAEGHPITTELPGITPTTFTVAINPTMQATRAQIESGQPTLMDVRSPAEFAGEASRAERKGHIPNALNIPRKTLLSDNGTLKPKAELQAMFAEAGIDPQSEDVVVYCNSGVSASYGLLALRVANITSGRVYDSSWKEWGNAEDTSIE